MLTCAVRSFSKEKLKDETALRCALPHFALRNDLSSLMQQGLTLAKILPLALNCVALVLPYWHSDWIALYY